ncbi:hypothetical protein HWV62_45496 [Athelia sp. TMB]|nr:hypothetical protein HWV62_45496 [Athelia sp. TMB]
MSYAADPRYTQHPAYLAPQYGAKDEPASPASPTPFQFHFRAGLNGAHTHTHGLQSASSSSSSLSLAAPYRFATPSPMHHAHWPADMDMDAQHAVLPYEYDDDDPPRSAGTKVVRKRSSKGACDSIYAVWVLLIASSVRPVQEEQVQVRARHRRRDVQELRDHEYPPIADVTPHPDPNIADAPAACTFLGPSRKRGPPKGYIDAIEARLHQTEALVGVLLFARSQDSRADGILADLEKDRVAREVIGRVARGAYGPGGRKGGVQSASTKRGAASASRSGSRSGSPGDEDEGTVAHPSLEWQDGLTALLLHAHDGDSEARRTRRRLSAPSTPDSAHAHSPTHRQSPDLEVKAEGGLLDAVGQLSLNEDEEVRYHGKASGLHLLGARAGSRNEGGIWRFPRARVWPPLPAPLQREQDRESQVRLPDRETQERLLEVYFAYVHPSFPVVDKDGFWEVWRNGHDTPVGSPASESSTSGSPFTRRRRHTPPLLLLAMLAIAERFAPTVAPGTPTPPRDAAVMWPAGDAHLDAAKTLLAASAASSRPSTCQALLLLGYREIGIGAMAQAWVFVGLAIRMAQDLGLHRAADGWARAGLGGRLFDARELSERRRIWWGAVQLDRYVSAYIGRPLGVFDGDWDVGLPGDDEAEERAPWTGHPTAPVPGSGIERETCPPPGTPGRVASTFKASTTLSIITGRIVLGVYGLKPGLDRSAESVRLEGELDRWLLDLPAPLRYDAGAPPPVLILHMQYWCSVLLLHRPFMRAGGGEEDVDARGARSYEVCAAAANHIASIVRVYSEKYFLTRAPVFLCYYVFTASIMHITTLTAHPTDPQAQVGLTKCMDALRAMRVVWPSAGRALELIRDARTQTEDVPMPLAGNALSRHKRSVDDLAAQDRAADQRGFAAQGYRTISNPVYLDGPQRYSDSSFAGRQPSSVQMSSEPYTYATHGRWQDGYAPAAPQPGPLSTAVLPQLYTGLADERISGGSGRYRQQGGSMDSSRYPQFWNDLNSFSQLGTYAPSGADAQGGGSEPSPMYISDPYNLYRRQFAV